MLEPASVNVPWSAFVVTGFGLVTSAVLLYLLGNRNERKVSRDWDLLLSPKGERLYRNIEGRVHNEMALATIAYDEAFSVRELGSIEESKQLLDVGYKVIEKFSPNMMKLLAAMTNFSRMVSAMAPVTPLRPRDFKLSQISSLAYLNGVLHQFLVSTSERFRLKMYILGRSFDLGTRFLLQSTQRIVKNEPESEREWEQVRAIRDDFQALTDESLEGLKQLLTSLAAERKDVDLDRFDRSAFYCSRAETATARARSPAAARAVRSPGFPGPLPLPARSTAPTRSRVPAGRSAAR